MGRRQQSLEAQLFLTGGGSGSFAGNGFLRVRGIPPADDLAELRDIYERMFRDKTGLTDGNYFDLAAGGEEVPVLPQITRMASYEPKLRHSLLWQNINAVSRQLLDDTADYVFDHGIRKPPNGPKTPWHQDFAYYGPGIRHRCVTFWVPLHDATVENGCMWFVPGSHHGKLLGHHPINVDPRIHGLEIRDAELAPLYPADLRNPAAGMVTCPIKSRAYPVPTPQTIPAPHPTTTHTH